MGPVVTFVAFIVLFVLLAIAAAGDIRSRTIPNKLVLSVVAAWAAWRVAFLVVLAVEAAVASCGLASFPACIAAVLSDGVFVEWLCETLAQLLASCAFAGMLLALVSAGEFFTGRYLLGGGDIKLLAAVSLFVGAYAMPVVLLSACLVSLAYALARSPRGIPFAPCVMCGVACAILLRL